MKSYFVHNAEVALHVLEKGEASVKAPSLLVINGLWEPAERAIPLLASLPGHVVTFSFRGRGLSSTPEIGYDLADHLGDIETVVKHCRLEDYCVWASPEGLPTRLAGACRTSSICMDSSWWISRRYIAAILSNP